MPAAARPWPDSLANTPTAAVIERAIARRRLAHSLLLHGEDMDLLVSAAFAIADRLLNAPESTAHFPAERHPDCFHLRPSGKMRQISTEATRKLIGKVQVSPSVSPRKVAIIHEADRMHVAAANVFLKTLEEPPANTTLLLLTARPYALLPTIRSRVLHFRFPGGATPVTTEGWPAWRADYCAWLERLADSTTDKRSVAGPVFSLYGLVARFGSILERATEEEWTKRQAALPEDLDDDERAAIETGLANGLRAQLFAEIEQATQEFAQPRLAAGDLVIRRAFTDAIEQLEHNVRLLRLNLNENAVLEDFLLSSLRIWSKRG